MRIGEKIKLVRQMRGLSQIEMADTLGLSQTGYGNIERNVTDPSLSRLAEIAEILSIDIRDLVHPQADAPPAPVREAAEPPAEPEPAVEQSDETPVELGDFSPEKVRLLEVEVAYLKEINALLRVLASSKPTSGNPKRKASRVRKA